MTKIIYQIRNILDGKVCVGQTRNFRIRKNEHLNALKRNCHKNPYLQNVYNKHGKEIFVIESLLEIEGTQAEIDDIETQMIKAVPKEMRYNILLVAGTKMNIKQSPESNQRRSKAMKGKTLSLEHCASLSKAWEDRPPHSLKTRAKMSESRKGEKNWNYGKTTPDEVRVKQSKAKKGDKNNRAKLTEIQAREIKFKHLPEGKLLQREIGEIYGVNSRTISNIKRGVSWRHLKPYD